MLSLVLALASVAPAQTINHDANTLFRSLLDPGLEVTPNHRVKLPPPIMPDGLDAAKQKEVIEGLIKGSYSFQQFTRDSVVAPYLLKIGDVKTPDPKSPARTVDVYFVIHGDFNLTDDPKFLDRLLNVGKGDGSGKGLTRDDLAKRKITWTAEDEKREGYGHVEFDFLEKVRLKVTGHAMWSKSSESVIAAAQVDPRFEGDPEYGNQWQPIIKEGGQSKYGPPQPYRGSGMYLKLTKLAGMPNAMFAEQHIVYSEPHGWFDGANLLRSKLPPVMQTSVRNMRREWAKGK